MNEKFDWETLAGIIFSILLLVGAGYVIYEMYMMIFHFAYDICKGMYILLSKLIDKL